MTTSAAAASKVMCDLGANACTDITGFGLLGHAFEMAKASDVTFELISSDVPLLPDVIELIEAGMLTRGDKNNRVYVGETVTISEGVSPSMQSALVRSADCGRSADKYRKAEGGRVCKSGTGKRDHWNR